MRNYAVNLLGLKRKEGVDPENVTQKPISCCGALYFGTH